MTGGHPDPWREHRQRWLPVLAASRLPEPDCRPARLTLLGQELAAFRDTDGNLGLIDGLCPHNGSLLAWGTAEEGGLTCAYHGWAFDVQGQCIWIPGSPNTPGYLAQYRVAAYRLVEAFGLLWAFLGDGDPPDSPEPPPWGAEAGAQIAATHWQAQAASTAECLAQEAAAMGWERAGDACHGVVLAGPAGLRLWVTAVPSLGRGFHCLAALWRPDGPLTAEEVATMADRASGPAAALAALAAGAGA